MSSESAVEEEEVYALDQMDRRGYIESQVASHPEYADRIVAEMYLPENRERYPIIERAIIETGFETGADGRTWPTRKPGEKKFIGWMDGREHAAYLEAKARARDDAMGVEVVDVIR